MNRPNNEKELFSTEVVRRVEGILRLVSPKTSTRKVLFEDDSSYRRGEEDMNRPNIGRRVEGIVRSMTPKTSSRKVHFEDDSSYRYGDFWNVVKQRIHDGAIKKIRNGRRRRRSLNELSESLLEIEGRVEASRRRLAHKEGNFLSCCVGKFGRSVGEDGYEKIRHVERMIDCINEYLNIYAQLVERNELTIIGSYIYKYTSHKEPRTSRKEWSLLSKNAQLEAVEKIARETMEPMQELLIDIEKIFPDVLTTKAGPLKGRKRLKEKRDNDYDGDILRVIDLVRCSVVVLSLADAKDIVDCFQMQRENRLFNQWELVRIKDGFAQPNNYITGGYRDVKINIRYKPNGHVIEVQLHLKEFYDLKVYGGGHKHYEFARTLEVDGVTDPLQLIDHDDIPWVIHVTEKKIAQFDDSKLVKEKVQCMRHIANLYKAINNWTSSIEWFEKALDLCKNENMNDKNIISTSILSQVQVSLASCIYGLWIDDRILCQSHQVHCLESRRDPIEVKWMRTNMVPMVDQAIDYLKEEYGWKHPCTLISRRVKVDLASIPSRGPQLYPVDMVSERVSIDELYEKLLSDQKDVLGDSHPEVLVTIHRYGTYMCDSIDDDDNATTFSPRKTVNDETRRYKDGVRLILEGLKQCRPRLGDQNTLFQDIVSSAYLRARHCEDEFLLDACMKVAGGFVHSRRSLTLETIDNSTCFLRNIKNEKR